MRSLRPALARIDALTPLGAILIVAAAYASVHLGAEISVGALLVALLFLAAVAGFLLAPHFMAALTIPLFALVPSLKIFVGPWIGPVKDLVSLAAIAAAAALLVLRRSGARSRVDGPALLLVALLFGLYVANVGGGHDIAWAQGVRLVGEPLLLLVAGMSLPQPSRTLRWAMASLVASSCLVAAVGLVEQYFGVWRLHELGYSFDQQIRTVDGRLRSFGTLDEPFAYAAFLLTGLVAVVFWMRRGPLAYASAGLIAAGIAVSYVRTAGLIVLALVGLWLARRGNAASATLIIAAAAVAAGAILVTATGASESRSFRSGNTVLTLNGRVDAWTTALGEPSDWPLGQGVGEVGTAAQRATYTIAPAEDAEAPGRAVDSGYLAAVADVGLVGLAVLLFLLGRLCASAARAVGRGRAEGWLAAGFLAVIVLDAVTRSSFTGFPTAFLGLFLVGLALAAAAEGEEAGFAHAAGGRRA